VCGNASPVAILHGIIVVVLVSLRAIEACKAVPTLGVQAITVCAKALRKSNVPVREGGSLTKADTSGFVGG
jgi:hypothetical protein